MFIRQAVHVIKTTSTVIAPRESDFKLTIVSVVCHSLTFLRDVLHHLGISDEIHKSCLLQQYQVKIIS